MNPQVLIIWKMCETSPSTRPARVHKPSCGIMFLHFLSQHRSVHGRMKHDKCGPEAGRKCSLRFLDAIFCSCYQSSVATDEMVHGLSQCELANRWEHAKSIACQEDHIPWVGTNTWYLCVRYIFDRVSSSSILCNGFIFVVYLPSVLIEYYIFEYCKSILMINDMIMMNFNPSIELCIYI